MNGVGISTVNKDSWIPKLWGSSSGILIETFAKKNFEITMRKDKWYDRLLIKRY